MHYDLIKDKEILNILYMELDIKGYQIKSRSDLIESINFYDKQMLDNFMIQKFASKLHKLTQMILALMMDDETDEGDLLLVLDDLDRIKTLAELNYKKHMKIENYKKFVDQIYFLEGITNQKLNELNYEISYQESVGRRM